MRSGWKVCNPAGPIECVVLTIHILLLMVDHLICRESYIYGVLRKNSSVHSVAVTQSCDTLVVTASSSLSSATSSPFFFLPWERVSWTFFRLSLCRSYQKPCNPLWGLAGRCETQLGPLNVSCWPSISPPSRLTNWYVGRAIYTECWGRIPQYTVLLSLSLVTHWLLLHIIFIISNIISLLLFTLRKSKLNLF